MKLFSPNSYLLMVIMGIITGALHSTPITIGMSAPLSGPSGHIGTSLLEGIQPTIININQKGGIDGRPIELVVLDDQYNPKKTIQNTIALVKEKKVDLLFSYVGTPTTLQAAPLLIKYNTPLFFPFTGAHVLHHGKIGDMIYHWRPNYWEESQALVNYFIKNNKTNIAIYYQKDAFGQSGLLGIKNALSQHQKNPISITSYPRGKSFSSNFSDEAQRLLEKKPDAIICISSYEASAGLIKAIRQKSTIPIATISFSDPVGVSEKLNNDPKLMINIIYSQVVPHKTQLLDLDDYTKTTKKSFTPIRYEGYKNTIKLIELLTNHSLKDIRLAHKDIQNELNEKHTVTLLKSTENGWAPL